MVLKKLESMNQITDSNVETTNRLETVLTDSSPESQTIYSDRGSATDACENEYSSSSKTEVSRKNCHEDDDDDNTHIKKIKKKRIGIIDSDSDDDDNEKNAPRLSLNISNSEEQNETKSSFNNEEEVHKQQSPKSNARFNIIDSENDDETVTNAPVYIINDRKELVPETDGRTMEERLATLCDSESSEDEEKEAEPIPYIRRNDDEANLGKKMTAKEAMEQRKEIDSESQRMLRDSHVSLPYHKPKQRSLKEFMQKRPRFASTVPADVKNASAAGAIKMTKDQLEIISKKIEEREKQVAEFYKSDSDDSEDDQKAKNCDYTENIEETEEIVDKVVHDMGNFDKNESETMKNTTHLEKERNEESETMKNTTHLEKERNEENEKIPEDGNNANEIQQLLIENEVHIEAKETTTKTNETCEGNVVTEDNPEKGQTTNTSSVDYELNLDDSDEEPEELVTSVDLLKADVVPKTKLELLKEKLGNSQPKLSGAPNYIIDFERNTTKPNEISQLINRFMHHTSKRPQQKHSDVELSITCVSQGGNIHQEKVAVKVEDNEIPVVVEKPGVKLQKLRNNLQAQMAQKRNELWQQKQQMKLEQDDANSDDDVYGGEKEHCGIDDILDDEEEEFSDGSDAGDSSNSEEDEEELPEVEKEIYEEQELGEEIENIVECTVKKKQLKRIIKPADDDSDDDFDDVYVDQGSRTLHMDSTVSWIDDDDCMPAGQTNTCRTPIKQMTQSKSELGFLSPVCRLTGLQSFDATGKFLQSSPGSPIIKLDEPSPLKDVGWAKSLFQSDNLDDICSGTFATPATVTAAKRLETLTSWSQDYAENEPSTQDLLALCSGNFDDISQSQQESKNDKEIEKTDIDNVNGGDGKKIEEITRKIVSSSQGNEEQRIDDDDDRLISQLIDEEELEVFRKKFESPVIQLQPNEVEANKNIAARIDFDDQEDESEDEEEITNFKRKCKNKMVDSDEDDPPNDAEEIDLHDDVDENEDELQQEDEGDDVGNLLKTSDTELGYDSEENEIVVDKPKKKLKLNDFVENEAELSESEWGSEDEDEGNLDQMDLEEGDTEHFDQKQLRRDLEKIHMRRMLDDDKQDIKVLQELYLGEDDELLGAGRQRQFRWRNIDNVDNEESSTNNDEEHSTHQDEEDDNEEEWRKKRFERELFLQSQKHKLSSREELNPNKGTLASDSQVLKLGQRAVIKNTILRNDVQVVTKKGGYSFNNQRGSFLSRKDEVLARVAEYTRVSDKGIKAPKNSRNFVFQTISNTNTCSEAGGNSSSNDDLKKRKAADAGTPMSLKRLRLTGFSPANQKKTDSKSKARLFTSNI